jgi:hypothetical protein
VLPVVFFRGMAMSDKFYYEYDEVDGDYAIKEVEDANEHRLYYDTEHFWVHNFEDAINAVNLLNSLYKASQT